VAVAMSLRHLRHKLDRLETLVGPPHSDPQPPCPFDDFAATFLKASDKVCSVRLRPVSLLHQSVDLWAIAYAVTPWSVWGLRFGLLTSGNNREAVAAARLRNALDLIASGMATR
jgi:hypothetical protein